MAADKVRENRLRRVAGRRGWSLQKSRARDPQSLGYGGYMLTDIYGGVVLLGGELWAFSASLDDVEAFLQ